MANFGAPRENAPVLRVGELARRAGLISEVQLKRALAEQEREAKTGRLPRQLGLILLSLGFLAETDLIKLLSEQEKQRSQMAKMDAPSPTTGSKQGAAPKGSVPVLRKLPTLVPRPVPGSGGAPPPRRP